MCSRNMGVVGFRETCKAIQAEEDKKHRKQKERNKTLDREKKQCVEIH